MPLPTLIVIGAAKAGTSSLHSYLDLHPEVGMSRIKELEFFLEEGNWRRGVEWYEKQFDPRFEVRGESSPRYTMMPHTPGLAERMRRVLGEAKLIYMVRDPVERSISHYQHAVALGVEHRPIDVALAEHDTIYTQCSLYMTQLEPFIAVFGEQAILIADQEQLRHDRGTLLREVFGFLGVDPSFESPAFAREWESTTAKSARFNAARRISQRLGATGLWGRMPQPVRQGVIRMLGKGRQVPTPELRPDLREALAEAVAPEAERLRAYSGRTFAGWSV